MSTEYMKFLTRYESGVIPLSRFIYVPNASEKRIFETIKKTWHANCSVKAVSKTLDWLVK